MYRTKESGLGERPQVSRVGTQTVVARCWGLLGVVVLGLVVSCSTHGSRRPTPKVEREASAATVLHAAVAVSEVASNQALLNRLCPDAFRYFRFVNKKFSERTCIDLKERMGPVPMVNLHGDAHVEQFAITTTGSGLVDFDDATTGPAYIDLVRFGVGLELVCHQRGWSSPEVLDAFFLGYREALANPGQEIREPDFVQAMRSELDDDRVGFLADVDALMEPVADVQVPEVMAGWNRYVELMVQRSPQLSASYFKIKRYGRVTAGIGSVLTPRYLVRIEGPSAVDDDDIVLEAKELGNLGQSPCVRNQRLRTIVARARLERMGGDPLAAVIPRGAEEGVNDPPFWIQAWRHDYREVDHTDLETPAQLQAIARLVGWQLAAGHIREVAATYDNDLAREQLAILELGERHIRDEIAELTQATLESWATFRSDFSCP